MAAGTLLEGMTSSSKSGEHSDLVLECGSDHYQVHKIILCSQSTWFDRACKHDRFEAKKEGESGVIKLLSQTEDLEAGDHPDLVKCMMHYLYHTDFSYPLPTNQESPDHSLLFDMAQPIALAEKYDIRGMVNKASWGFRFALEKTEWSVGQKCAAVAQLYGGQIPKSTRNVLAAALLGHIAKAAIRVKSHPQVKQLVTQYPDFACDLLEQYAIRTGKLKDRLDIITNDEPLCPYCHRYSGMRCMACDRDWSMASARDPSCCDDDSDRDHQQEHILHEQDDYI